VADVVRVMEGMVLAAVILAATVAEVENLAVAAMVAAVGAAPPGERRAEQVAKVTGLMAAKRAAMEHPAQRLKE